jgi:hAT family C-terminal dimerisation region
MDPLQAWRIYNRENRYHLLSQVAIDILAVPATSACVERLFSQMGRSVTPKRNRLLP